MLYATGYRMRCDICQRWAAESDINSLLLRKQLDNAGWAIGRRSDGQVAKQMGKDYCPECIPVTWTVIL